MYYTDKNTVTVSKGVVRHDVKLNTVTVNRRSTKRTADSMDSSTRQHVVPYHVATDRSTLHAWIANVLLCSENMNLPETQTLPTTSSSHSTLQGVLVGRRTRPVWTYPLEPEVVKSNPTSGCSPTTSITKPPTSTAKSSRQSPTEGSEGANGEGQTAGP